MPKKKVLGQNTRMSFNKIDEILEMPNLIEIQKDSYDWFINEGLKEVFEDMTSAGGKFYNMQEVQAETLSGKISNLKDAYDIMLTEIGDRTDGALRSSVEVLYNLINNSINVTSYWIVIISNGSYDKTFRFNF